MKATVEKLLEQALITLKQSSVIPQGIVADIKVERTKDASHGDYACNIALMLAKPCALPPRKIAELLVQVLGDDPLLERVEIAGPGFINFFMRANERAQIIAAVLNQGEAFGRSNVGQGQKVLLEFVSANPTGP